MPVPSWVRSLRHLLTTVLIVPLVLVGGVAASPGIGSRSATGVVTADAASLDLVGSTTRVRRALRIAKNQKGDPYSYGAAGPHRFDCSGLVYFATHKAGFLRVPRTSSAQARFMDRIKRSRMRPGDFVFFTGSSGVYHVGIYVGWRDGRRAIVHSPYSGTRVRTDRIWTSSWFAGTLR